MNARTERKNTKLSEIIKEPLLNTVSHARLFCGVCALCVYLHRDPMIFGEEVESAALPNKQREKAFGSNKSTSYN
jgi:hypothetical protein